MCGIRLGTKQLLAMLDGLGWGRPMPSPVWVFFTTYQEPIVCLTRAEVSNCEMAASARPDHAGDSARAIQFHTVPEAMARTALMNSVNACIQWRYGLSACLTARVFLG